ncbi:MAG: HAMP domain-containing protein [Spirochaetales bacterium]|nr:HAMP domain-containing protein [Spirochaetales bacterium]
MKGVNSRNTGFVGIISLMFVYLIIIVVILIFVNQMLSDSAQNREFQYFILIPIGIILPLVLLGAVILNVLRLIRQSRARSPGSGFKVRLTLFFALLVFFSSIPQAVLSLTFIRTTLNSWFSSTVEEALEGGVELGLEFYGESVESLDAFCKSRLSTTFLQTYTGEAGKMWEFFHEADPRLDSLQIFDSQGEDWFFAGNTDARLFTLPLDGRKAGVISRQDQKGLSLIRGQVKYKWAGEEYTAIFTEILPVNFDIKARNLTRALEAFIQYRKLQGQFFSAFLLFYSIFSFPLFLLSLLVSFLLSEEIIRPIVNLEAATKRVAEGDYSFRILTRSGDELSNLINSFNQMISELERSRKKILQTEKIAAWQEIAQRLAHEIKNPLTPIKLSAQRIKRRYETRPEEIGEVLEKGVASIVTEVDSLTELLSEFRDFSRLPAPYLQPVHLSILIRETLATYAGHYPHVIVDDSDLDEDLVLPLDQGQIKRVFSNLIKNAFESIEESGRLSFRYDLVRKGNTSYSRIRIEDTGVGIKSEDQNKVFNPYFTTKTGGTGLGLPIVERIIFDHKGQIWFESEEGEGTTFFIDLPHGESY